MKTIYTAITAFLFIASAISLSAGNLFPSQEMTRKNGWQTWIAKSAVDAGGFAKLEEGKIIVNSPNLGMNTHATLVQIIGAINAPPEKTYILRIKIKSDKAGYIPFDYAQMSPPYAVYSTSAIELQAGEKEYVCKFDVKKGKDGSYAEPRGIRIFVGDLEGANLTFSEAYLEEEAKP